MSSSQLIVNADDFGLTDGVNRAVRQAHEEGVLTSTTVLVNMPAAVAAGEMSKELPNLDFGLHLNFTLGEPVSAPERVPTLVDTDGRFFDYPTLVRRVARRLLDASELSREATAQVSRLRELGVEPSHWDSHQAAAFWPGLVGPASAAAAAAGLHRVRSPRIWIAGGGRPGRWRWSFASPKRLLTQPARRYARARLSSRFRMPEWRLSPNLISSPGADYRDRWRQALADVPTGISEIVSHPARIDSELQAITPGLVSDRAVDLEVLCDADVAASLKRAGVELVGFRRLDRLDGHFG